MANYRRRGGGPRGGRKTPSRSRNRRSSMRRKPMGARPSRGSRRMKSPMRKRTMRGGRGVRRGMGGMIPDVPPALANGTVVYESSGHTNKTTPYICPPGHKTISEECIPATEQQQRLFANGSLTKEHGPYRGPRGTGGRKG